MTDWARAPTEEMVAGLVTALGAGLLIGVDRERRKGRGPARAAAGLRSFTLAALAGALAALIDVPGLEVVCAVAVAALAALAYRHSLRGPAAREGAGNPGSPSIDPGVTTELALVVTYLIGVLSARLPALGAGAAVVVAVLLAGRERLHHFATELLTAQEWHDALLLAAVVMVLLPLAPAEPLAWLGGASPRRLAMLLVLILALQAAGHAARRAFGARSGLALAGACSGFVSSTATIAAMGARARAEPELARACLAGALMSTAATWVQALLIVLALAPAALAGIAAPAAAGLAVAVASGAWAWRGAPVAAGDGSGAAPPAPLRLREAALVALLLATVSAALAWAHRLLGEPAALAGAALAALADAHAPIAALAALQAGGRIETPVLLVGLLVAIGSNSVTRTVTAFVAGGRGFAAPVAASLVVAAAAAAAVGILLS